MLSSLTYASTPCILAHSTDMLDIARIALRKNAARNVTGALYYSDRLFFQVLEGERPDIDAIFESILRDPRHSDITLLHVGPLAARRFGGWAMRFCDGADHPHLRVQLERSAPPGDAAAVTSRIEALLAP